MIVNIKKAELIEDFHDLFKEVIQNNVKKRTVIFIDDLDRCDPKNVIKVLEAVKLFLDVEGCIFIMGMDRRVISESVKVKYKGFITEKKNEIISGDNYLEKIVQLIFQLPELTDADIRKFIEEELDIPDFYSEPPYIDMIIKGIENNPRKIKRFFNIIELQRHLVGSIPEIQEDIKNEKIKIRFDALLLEWAIISSYYSDFRKEVEEKKWILHEFHEFLGSKLSKDPDLVVSELSDIPDKLQIYWNKNRPILELIKVFHKEIPEIPGFDEIERVIHLSSVAPIIVEEAEIKVEKEEILDRSQVIAKILNKENMKGAILRHQYLEGQTLSGIDLSYSNLTGVLLNEAAIVNVKLNSAKLIGASLSKVIISDTVMSGADMSSANLSEADLYRVALRNVTMKKTNLKNAKLRHCNLENARFDNETDFSGAEFDWFTLSHLKDSNWNEAIWDSILLEKIRKEYV